MRVGFVVEGFNDEQLVKSVMPSAVVVVTKGTRMNNRVRLDLAAAQNVVDELLLLTDPDTAGDLLAEMVRREHPAMRRVEVPLEACLCFRNGKHKVGVEHMDAALLKDVFEAFGLDVNDTRK